MSTGIQGQAYIEEALGWLPEQQANDLELDPRETLPQRDAVSALTTTSP